MPRREPLNDGPIQNNSGPPHGPTGSPGGRLSVRQSRREGPPMSGMGRREFLALLGGAAAAWPLAARAQQPERMRRIGIIPPGTENDTEAQARLAAFRQAMEQLGWKESHNIRFEYRWTSGDAELFKKHAAELVASAPDQILTGITPVVQALKRETRTIPIVTSQTRSAAASFRIWRNPAAMSPGSRRSSTRSSENGWSCLRRSRPASSGWR